MNIQMPLTLASKRDIHLSISGGCLRPLLPEDIHQGYIAGLNDPEINQYLVSVREKTQTYETVNEFVSTDFLSEDAVLFGIWAKGHPKHCGTVRLHCINRSKRTAIIGICIFDKNAWGRSIGADAIRAVSSWAFAYLGIRAIEAGAYAENIGSWRAFLKAGYIVAEDIHGRYQLEGKSVVVRKLVAYSPATGSCSLHVK